MQKSHPITIIIHLIVSIFAGLFAIGTVLDFVRNDAVIFGIGIAAFTVTWLFLRKRKTVSRQTTRSNFINTIEHVPSTSQVKAEVNRPYKFIFTHSEKALDAIESTIENHPKVTSVFQDSGNWYSNGETGPEWFSMHVRCKVEDTEEIQQFINDALAMRGYEAVGRYMGSYN